MTSLLVIAPAHAIFNTPPCIFMALTNALEQLDDGRTIEDIDTVMALTRDAQDGWNSVRAIGSYQRLDAVIAFGKASASVGLPDAEMLTPSSIQLRSQIDPVHFVRLPSPISSWWHGDDSPVVAGVAVKPLLQPLPALIKLGDSHLAWDAAEFN